MVSTRNPKSFVSLHSFHADNNILQSSFQGMAHVQFAGNVGGSDAGDEFYGIVAIRTFGYESFRGDSPLFILRSSICRGSPVSLEEYILKYRTTPWQRFRALFLVNRILLGSFMVRPMRATSSKLQTRV